MGVKQEKVAVKIVLPPFLLLPVTRSVGLSGPNAARGGERP
jgi:hypothetical protein